MLHHITRDGSSPNGKQRVFFCAAPGQVKELFPKISAEIFEFCHCVIWYDDGENTPRQDLQNAIEMSSLAVLPVTAELFAPDSVVKRVMLPLVFSHRVTLLPILEDPNLLEPFNAQFKNIQLLDRHSVDATALPYREKLERFLDAALLRDELASQVKHAFSARIFLSYRKIDRQMARDLMRSVQREPKCRSIAFWYDEFLTPGEDFDKNIRSAIDDSDLFLLSLTENMLRAGNYVIREEYPYAHDTCKPILPVELEPVDLAQAARYFRDLPETVKQAQITNRLAALGVEHTTPQQDYLLGQAYLHGLQQERNVALLNCLKKVPMEAMRRQRCGWPIYRSISINRKKAPSGGFSGCGGMHRCARMISGGKPRCRASAALPMPWIAWPRSFAGRGSMRRVLPALKMASSCWKWQKWARSWRKCAITTATV